MQQKEPFYDVGLSRQVHLSATVLHLADKQYLTLLITVLGQDKALVLCRQ